MFQFYHRPGDPPTAIKQTATTDTFFMSILDVTNFPTKFQISCWPLTTAFCPAERNFLDGEKFSQTTNNCCSSEFCIKNNKNVSLRLSSLKIMITRGEGHAPGTGGEGLMTALAVEGRCLMSWWRLIMADHISVWSPVAWSGPGLACSDLSRIMSYETQHSQLSR